MTSLQSSIFALLLVISTSFALRSSLIGFYRIEAEFFQLENENGIQGNGQTCDEVTTCDPVVYYYIDVEQPLANWPGGAIQSTDLEMLTWKRNANSYAVNQTVRKDICGGGLGNVNVRVEILDEDFFGKYDMIERFQCKFYPTIMENPDFDGTQWTLTDTCTATHQPDKIKLFYRWRVFKIPSNSCGKVDSKVELKLQSPTARPPMNAGEP